MKKNTRFYSMYSAFISIIIIVFGTGLVGTASICLAQDSLWTHKADIPTSRWYLSSCEVNGKIYAIGGVRGYNKVEEYDPATDSWDTTKAPMPTGRAFLVTGAVNEKIYAIGGSIVFEPGLGTNEEYDPETDTWDTSKTDMPTPRHGICAAVVDEKIYVIGGEPPVKKVEMYDPATDTWDSTLTDMPTARWAPTCGVVKGKIYVFGGFLSQGGPSSDALEVYDPVTDTWETGLTIMPGRRTAHATAVVNDQIYIFGGTTYGGGPALNNLWKYDPATDTWDTSLPNMPFNWFVMGYSEVNNRVYLMAGSEVPFPHEDSLKRVEEYRPYFSLPSIPELVYPIGLQDTTAVEFVWTMSNPLVTRYWFEIAADHQFTNSFIDSTITDTTYLYSNLNYGESYWWRVKAYNSWGWGEFSEVRTFNVILTSVEEDNQQPIEFSLEQNYPNPFNPNTLIKYQIPELSLVTLKVYDALGSEIITLVNEERATGSYEVEFDATSLPSGIYFYKLQAGSPSTGSGQSFVETKKMILLK